MSESVPLLTEDGVTQIPVSAEFKARLEQMRGEPVTVRVTDGRTGETVWEGTSYIQRPASGVRFEWHTGAPRAEDL